MSKADKIISLIEQKTKYGKIFDELNKSYNFLLNLRNTADLTEEERKNIETAYGHIYEAIEILSKMAL